MEVKGNNDARAKIVCRGAFYYASLNFFIVIFFHVAIFLGGLTCISLL